MHREKSERTDTKQVTFKGEEKVCLYFVCFSTVGSFCSKQMTFGRKISKCITTLFKNLLTPN